MGSVFTRPSYISYFLSESYATLSDHINILQQENDIENYVNEVQMQIQGRVESKNNLGEAYISPKPHNDIFMYKTVEKMNKHIIFSLAFNG